MFPFLSDQDRLGNCVQGILAVLTPLCLARFLYLWSVEDTLMLSWLVAFGASLLAFLTRLQFNIVLARLRRDEKTL